MNKCLRILCFWHKHFLFGCLLWSVQLKTIWESMTSSTTKMTKPLRFVLFLASEWLGFLGFDSLRSTLVLLIARTFFLGTLTSIKEIDVAGTNLGGWTTKVETLYTNPNLVLSEKYFWTFNISSSLEVEVLSSCSLATDNSDSKLLTFSIKDKFLILTEVYEFISIKQFDQQIFLFLFKSVYLL